MNRIHAAIWSGIIATGPMTMFMMSAQKKLKKSEQSPLPPATLTKEITGSDNPNVTLTSHFGYGAAAGVFYSFLPARFQNASTGSLFGIAVWALSYLGWAPAAGMRANFFNMPRDRNLMMALAHIVWGASLGHSQKFLQRFGDEMLEGGRKAIAAE